MNFNFKSTVLEDHWENDARIGTKMKLESSTFCFSKQCLCLRSFSGWETRTAWHTTNKNESNSQSDPPRIYRKCWIKFAKFKISASDSFHLGNHSQSTYCPKMNEFGTIWSVLGPYTTTNQVLKGSVSMFNTRFSSRQNRYIAKLSLRTSKLARTGLVSYFRHNPILICRFSIILDFFQTFW